MLWRVHRRTVNPSPLGKHYWFESNLIHQNLCESGGMVYAADLKSAVARHTGSSPVSRTSLSSKESKRRMGKQAYSKT